MKKNDLDNKPSPLWVLDTSELNPNLLLSYYHPTPTPARVPPLSLWGGAVLTFVFVHKLAEAAHHILPKRLQVYLSLSPTTRTVSPLQEGNSVGLTHLLHRLVTRT